MTHCAQVEKRFSKPRQGNAKKTHTCHLSLGVGKPIGKYSTHPYFYKAEVDATTGKVSKSGHFLGGKFERRIQNMEGWKRRDYPLDRSQGVGRRRHRFDA
jgi:hypothetical protein